MSQIKFHLVMARVNVAAGDRWLVQVHLFWPKTCKEVASNSCNNGFHHASWIIRESFNNPESSYTILKIFKIPISVNFPKLKRIFEEIWLPEKSKSIYMELMIIELIPINSWLFMIIPDFRCGHSRAFVTVIPKLRWFNFGICQRFFYRWVNWWRF